MITANLRAAYAPQTVYSPTRLPYEMPLAPVAPRVSDPSLPTTNPYPGRIYTTQTAPATPPLTTPESADVMAPTKRYTLPNYGYPMPQSPPNPSGVPTRWAPEATATEPTLEIDQPGIPEGSIEAELSDQLTPWYKRPLPLVGLTIGGGIAIVGAILLLRK